MLSCVSWIFVLIVVLNLSVHVSPRLVARVESELYDFDFFSRGDWGALASSDTRPLHRPVPFVIIHHTYLPAACYSFRACSANMKAMQQAHNSIGWGDIGYNFCVGSEGGVYEGRGWDTVGVHAGSANNHSVGICLIGDYRDQLPPAIQLQTTKKLIRDGVRLGKIQPNYKLIGHRQAMDTECPGNALLKEISSWNFYKPGQIDFKNCPLIK